MREANWPLCWTIILILSLPCFGFGQATTKLKAVPRLDLENAVTKAELSLKAYKQNLVKYADLSEVAATSKKDAEPILVGGMGVVLIKAKLALQPPTVDPFEITALFANIDACALNAALTAGSLKPVSYLDGGDKISKDRFSRNLEAANALVVNVQQLKESGDQLWTILEGYLGGLKPWPVLAAPSK
jgi:hypothetical protein